ncbi:MAG: hypothetical protein IPJ41_02310 [Phycisphaerales bacterium]|nr:hypothetical protein [Phycisphaerales bacterium]
MRRAACTISAVLGCLVFGGCEAACSLGSSQTSMLVVNHTSEPISVSFAQEPANAEATAISVDQRVLPGHSVRFAGLPNDHLSVQAGSDPAMVLEFAKRSQVVSVQNEGGELRYEVRKGFNE